MMSTRTEDNQFYAWLFGKAEYPIRTDSITVPYPFNYKPIEVDYTPVEEAIEVEVK